MLIFYSALRVVPVELYEAAEIDGAGALRIIRRTKLPALRPAIMIATIFSVIGSLQLFNEPNILQSLAPNTIGTKNVSLNVGLQAWQKGSASYGTQQGFSVMSK
jgi:multiple sugar transport system permease protein